jgi:hypothetical protein
MAASTEKAQIPTMSMRRFHLFNNNKKNMDEQKYLYTFCRGWSYVNPPFCGGTFKSELISGRHLSCLKNIHKVKGSRGKI